MSSQLQPDAQIFGMDLEHDILSHIAGAEGPVGSGQIFLSLRERHGLGQASIGRRLQELDRAGYTRRLGFRGRVLTPEGRKRLQQLSREVAMKVSHQRLLKSLDATNVSRLIEVLVVRRILEKEAAKLAALNAAPNELQEMAEALEAQRSSVLTGDDQSASKWDYEFHDGVALASGNEVLRRMLILLASESQLSRYTSEIRTRAGGELLVDHEEILRHLRARDPEAAERAMEQHLDGLIGDVNRLWRRENQGGGRSGDDR